jgi:hypothetical protein
VHYPREYYREAERETQTVHGRPEYDQLQLGNECAAEEGESWWEMERCLQELAPGERAQTRIRECVVRPGLAEERRPAESECRLE